MGDDKGVNRSNRALVLAGVLTGVAGLVTSQATVWILGARNGPVDAVAAAVRDFTPGGLAHELVNLVGKADKPLLLGGTAILLLALCGWAGVLARTRPAVPDILYFVLAALGLGAVLRLEDSGTGSAVGVVVGLITWLGVHRLLTGPVVAAGPELDPASRRVFLQRVGWGGAAVGAFGIGGVFSNRSKRDAEQSRDLVRLDRVRRGVQPEGAEIGRAHV